MKYFIITTFLILGITAATYSQSHMPPPFPDKPEPTPITGVELMALAAGGYGAYKLRKKQKE